MPLKQKTYFSRARARIEARHVDVVQTHRSLGQCQRPADAAEQGALAAAVGPQHGQDFSSKHIEIECAQHRLLAVAKGGAAYFDQRRYCHDPRVLRSR